MRIFLPASAFGSIATFYRICYNLCTIMNPAMLTPAAVTRPTIKGLDDQMPNGTTTNQENVVKVNNPHLHQILVPLAIRTPETLPPTKPPPSAPIAPLAAK